MIFTRIANAPLFSKLIFTVGISTIILIGLISCSSQNLGESSTGLTTKSNILSIEHEIVTLENGLTVILHQDDSDPLVNVNVTYHVGSAREEYGKSGFAHFFEHMMFQGSENVADEEHFRIVTEAGGSMNGSTNSDITNYYQTVPLNQLEKVLWLEADRMGFLLDAVTQEKFETQRETVKNERGQRIDNRPYGLRSEKIGEALYPIGHPYSWSVIGYVEDLNRVDVNDLKAFFQKWYGPNNAVLTVGGDIDKAQTLTWIKKYFGSIPAGPSVEKADKQPAKLENDRYLTLEDKVHLPLLQITLPTVYAGHTDEAPLDVLADILGSGKTSLFYKNMVKNGLAVQAAVSHPCRELACEFNLLALANPDEVDDLSQLHKIINDTLREFEIRGVQPDDLKRTKTSIEAGSIFGLQSVEGKVRQLANGQVFYAQADRVQTDLNRYNMVTAEDVMRVFQQYIKDKPAVNLSIVPVGQPELQAFEPNFELPERVFEATAKQSASDTVANVSTQVQANTIVDNFDRSVPPKAGVNPNISLPDFWRDELSNGIEILGVNSDETPTVTLYLAMEGGVLLDPIDKPGVAILTAQMMNESTKRSSNEELSNRLALLGSSVGFSASGRYTNLYVSSLRKNISATLEIMNEKLFSPGFQQSDFDRLKQRMLQGMQQSLKNPSILANRAQNMVLYGTESRVGLPDEGTLASIQSITLEDLKQFYEKFYRPNIAQIVIVGDIEQDEMVAKLSGLLKWQVQEVSIPTFKGSANQASRKVYLVDNPDSVQSVVSLFRPAMVFDADADYFKATLMNFPLGGMFNSRINLNLREDKGYTYGARSGFSGGKDLGEFSAGADVAAEHTVASIEQFIAELTRYQLDGMNEQELQMMKRSITQRDALRYETPDSKAGFLIQLLNYDLSGDYREKQTQIINQIGIRELNKLAQQWLDPNSMDILVVGDAKNLQQSLQSLGREIIILDVPR